MDITKVLSILNNHIIKLEEDIYLKDWEIEKLRKELEQLKSGLEEKIKKYEKIIKIKWKNIITGVLLIDLIRTFCILAFNVTASLTLIGSIVLVLELLSIEALTMNEVK